MDSLPQLIQGFVLRGADAAPLRQEVGRHVGAATRRYPDAYFNLGRKCPEAVDDLANRVFTTCARVEKGRFPFLGRVPFRAYTDDAMGGPAIRYHTFYAQVSITRELLRADYEHNLVRDPRLRWRADLYAEVGHALRELGERVPGGTQGPPRWRGRGLGPTLLRRDEDIVEDLRASGITEVPALVARALRATGPTTQSRLANLIADALPGEGGEAFPAPALEPEEPSTPIRLAVREAVLGAWRELEDPDRALMTALAAGLSADELIARDPRFKHRVAVTRAVERTNRVFLAHLYPALGLERAPEVPPRELLELLFEVLVMVLPELQETMTMGGVA